MSSAVEAGWGDVSNPKYEGVAARFGPIFAEMAAGAVERELARELPFAQIGWLKDAKLGALRVSEEEGGFGLGLPELFSLLIELSEADSNITQALRDQRMWAIV